MNTFDIFFFENHSTNGKYICQEDGNYVVWYECADGYGKQIVPMGADMVCTQIKFYPDTMTIASEGQYLKDWHEPIGVWKTYDREGQLTNEDDRDVDYPVKWNQMKQILEGNHVNLDDIMRGWRQKPQEGHPEWRFQMKTVNRTMETLRFDAVTGNLLERKSIKLKRV